MFFREIFVNFYSFPGLSIKYVHIGVLYCNYHIWYYERSRDSSSFPTGLWSRKIMVLKQFWKVLFCAAMTVLILGWTGNANVFVAQAQDGTLPPVRQQSTTELGQRDFDAAETPFELLTKAQTFGSVRVIVGFNTSTRFQPEGALSAVQAQVQQHEITQVRQSLLQTILSNNATLQVRSAQ